MDDEMVAIFAYAALNPQKKIRAKKMGGVPDIISKRLLYSDFYRITDKISPVKYRVTKISRNHYIAWNKYCQYTYRQYEM
jgi:hypothetical protein